MHSDNPPGFRRLHSEVDRIFLDMLRGEGTPRYTRGVLRPNADVYLDNRAGHIIIKLELAGIDPTGIDLEIDEGILRVSGSRTDERHPDRVYQQMEINYGRFERVVTLPREADAAGATANYNAGFLEITIPIRPRSASKRIHINTNEECAPEGGQIS